MAQQRRNVGWRMNIGITIYTLQNMHTHSKIRSKDQIIHYPNMHAVYYCVL